MTRTEAAQTCRMAAAGIDGLAVHAQPATAGPAVVTSVLVILCLPFAAAQGLAGRSVPMQFRVAVVALDSGPCTAASAVQVEPSTFFVPR